ncbi:MAG: hypothetical protein H6657_15470 [Ardenticatenaceae bacterium]|nr:hypothetical protein [Anaerolineales bacterium]MCB8978817.1 hypothetical protein [Ardenticatenaceae bacterium]
MLSVDTIEYPSKYLSCYESVLMTLLKHQGINDEAALFGTQAYFVFTPEPMGISPKLHSVDDEWQRLYGYQVQIQPIADEAALRHVVNHNLAQGVPVCLPVDIFALPHTMHYQQLHQHHYVNLFAAENGRYYLVCPYYRFQGWVDAALVHDGFFSPVVAAKGAVVITLPQVERPFLTEATVLNLIEENCRFMLNLAAPAALAQEALHLLGLAGLQTFATTFQQMADTSDSAVVFKSDYINLSRHLTAVGHSRYWFQQLIAQQGSGLFSPGSQEMLAGEFTAVIQAWKSLGLQLGMGVHGQRAAIIQRVAAGIQEMHKQETRLFNTVLGALPTYEQGTL